MIYQSYITESTENKFTVLNRNLDLNAYFLKMPIF